MSTAKLAATIKVKASKSKLPGVHEDAPSLLVELPSRAAREAASSTRVEGAHSRSGDGCVALNDADTLQSLQSDPEMKSDAISHLQSLQNEISKVMKTLQQA